MLSQYPWIPRLAILSLIAAAFFAPTGATAMEDKTVDYYTLSHKAKVLKEKIAQSKSYDFQTHNELRDLYWRMNQYDDSVRECEIILENSGAKTADNDYIVSVLAEWKLDKYPQEALAILQDKAKRYKQFPCISAACLLKAGRSFRKGTSSEAGA